VQRASGIAVRKESIMHGQITKYRADLGCGVIEADDGRKFRFVKGAIVNPDGGLVGSSVDFLVVGSQPAEIIMLRGSPWTVFAAADRN
jgi:hypothetical protein